MNIVMEHSDQQVPKSNIPVIHSAPVGILLVGILRLKSRIRRSEAPDRTVRCCAPVSGHLGDQAIGLHSKQCPTEEGHNFQAQLPE